MPAAGGGHYNPAVSLPPILCVTGPSGSGKTTLLARLILLLSAAGLRVGAVKQCPTHLESGPAGKDSSRLAAAGARPAIAVGPGGLVVQSASAPLPLLDLAATLCADCDLVLVEGQKQSPHDKILVTCGSASAAPETDLGAVRLRVTYAANLPPGAVARDDVAAVAAWVKDWLDRRRRLACGVVGAILVGGRSRRMGFDKATLRLGGRPVLPRLADLLGGRLGEVWMVGRPPGDLGLPQCLRWHLDLRPGCGPLGGIATALRVAGGDRPRAVLAVACDMPALGGDALDLLLEQRRPDRPASVLRHPVTGRFEPLAAVYEPQALEGIEKALDGGALSVTDWLESAGAHGIDVPASLANQLINVNTPDDL